MMNVYIKEIVINISFNNLTFHINNNYKFIFVNKNIDNYIEKLLDKIIIIWINYL